MDLKREQRHGGGAWLGRRPCVGRAPAGFEDAASHILINCVPPTRVKGQADGRFGLEPVGHSELAVRGHFVVVFAARADVSVAPTREPH